MLIRIGKVVVYKFDGANEPVKWLRDSDYAEYLSDLCHVVNNKDDKVLMCGNKKQSYGTYCDKYICLDNLKEDLFIKDGREYNTRELLDKNNYHDLASVITCDDCYKSLLSNQGRLVDESIDVVGDKLKHLSSYGDSEQTFCNKKIDTEKRRLHLKNAYTHFGARFEVVNMISNRNLQQAHAMGLSYKDCVSCRECWAIYDQKLIDERADRERSAEISRRENEEWDRREEERIARRNHREYWEREEKRIANHLEWN